MNRDMRPTWIAMCVLVIATVVGLHAMTHGFRAVTRDTARQLAIAEAPRLLPPLTLVDSHGRHADLRERVAGHAYTVVALVYTQCTTLCLVMASSEAFLQARLRETGLDAEAGLLTISFDPARDTPAALAQYAARMKADPSRWTITTVADPMDLGPLLEVFDVTVIPDGNGEYLHNGALFLVDRDGQLFEAHPPEAADAAWQSLATRLRAP